LSANVMVIRIFEAPAPHNQILWLRLD